MRKLLIVVISMLVVPVTAQEFASKFREDQVYFGVAYPYFSNPPETLIQNKLSYAFSLGFIRDMPINKKRTWAVGLGIGGNVTKWFTNTQFFVSRNNISTKTITDDYRQNFITMQSLEFPFEVRWRNATTTKHAFWRIHTGVSLNIPLRTKTLFTPSNGTETSNFLSTNGTFLRGNLHFGFNTWNISIAHDIEPWVVSDSPNGKFNVKSTKVGLIFYLF